MVQRLFYPIKKSVKFMSRQWGGETVEQLEQSLN